MIWYSPTKNTLKTVCLWFEELNRVADCFVPNYGVLHLRMFTVI